MNLEINIETRININEVHELAKFIEETQLVSDSIIRKYDNIKSAIIEFDNYESLFIKAYLAEELVGLMFGCNSIFILSDKSLEYFPCFYISDLAVKISHRNMGIAKAMINQLESIVKDRDYKSITADTKFNGRSYNLLKSIRYKDTKSYSAIGFHRLIKIL